MRRALAAPLALVFLLSGCTFFSKGHTHVEYNAASTKIIMTRTKVAGQYALFIGDDPIPSAVQLLKKGETFGFEKNDEGRIRAVAGTYSTVLPGGTRIAVWKPEPRDGRS